MYALFFILLFVVIGIYLWYQSRDHVPNYDERNFLGGDSDPFDFSDYHGDNDYYNSYRRRSHSSSRRTSYSSRGSHSSFRSSGHSSRSSSGRGRGGGGRSGGGGAGRR